MQLLCSVGEEGAEEIAVGRGRKIVFYNVGEFHEKPTSLFLFPCLETVWHLVLACDPAIPPGHDPAMYF